MRYVSGCSECGTGNLPLRSSRQRLRIATFRAVKNLIIISFSPVREKTAAAASEMHQYTLQPPCWECSRTREKPGSGLQIGRSDGEQRGPILVLVPV